MMRLAFALLMAVSAGALAAQPAKKSQMTKEDRQRMREDMRDVYRDRRERPDRHDRERERGRQMTPEERDKLRRDIENANRDLRRR